MSEKEYREVVERVRAAAGTCFATITEEEIQNIINRFYPDIGADRYTQLISECSQLVQIVSPEEKEQLLRLAYPADDRNAGSGPADDRKGKPDPALADRFFCILMQRQAAPKVRACWEKALDRDARYRTIMRKRTTVSPAQLAGELGISLEAFYELEREMIMLYYESADEVRRGE